ncbi:MAG: pyridoxamine 5'-phosphate oxidase family protein, partial [Pseudanabaenaceae cyanobacterium]
MAKFYPTLTPALQAFIAAQHIFFVATAPHQGRVNLSPKGGDTFRCLGDRAFAYLDLTGSGNETAAHVNENGRLTVMFCNVGSEPTILRLYGRARIVRPNDPDWAALAASLPSLPGTRQIVQADLLEAQTSCGYGVPHYEWVG